LSSKCTTAWRKQYQPWNLPDEKFLFLDGVEIFIEKMKENAKYKCKMYLKARKMCYRQKLPALHSKRKSVNLGVKGGSVYSDP
jgi:hypothetical protein